MQNDDNNRQKFFKVKTWSRSISVSVRRKLKGVIRLERIPRSERKHFGTAQGELSHAKEESEEAYVRVISPKTRRNSTKIHRSRRADATRETRREAGLMPRVDVLPDFPQIHPYFAGFSHLDDECADEDADHADCCTNETGSAE